MTGKVEERDVRDRLVDCTEELPVRDVLKVVGGRVDRYEVTVYVEGVAVAVTVAYTTSQSMVCTSEPDQSGRSLTGSKKTYRSKTAEPGLEPLQHTGPMSINPPGVMELPCLLKKWEEWARMGK